MSKPTFSRRDFLRVGSAGLLGMFLPRLAGSIPRQDDFSTLQGRMIHRLVFSYEEPDTRSRILKLYWQDLVVPITDITLSEDETAHNRIWYRLEDGGYAHSRGIQPVRTLLNTPAGVPASGALGEVSVPYTDARLGPDPGTEFVYRLYYETVHWVASAAEAPDGLTWYRLLDDKYERYYYVRADHIRLLGAHELDPISPQVPADEKRVEVRLAEQLLLAYEQDRLVFATRVATGGKRLSGGYTTPAGSFITYHKRPTRHMASGEIASNGFDFPGVPWVLYITESGISFHGTYWHNDYGTPQSHGCINMTPQAAKWLYRWTLPTVPPEKYVVYGHAGTRVEIQG